MILRLDLGLMRRVWALAVEHYDMRKTRLTIMFFSHLRSTRKTGLAISPPFLEIQMIEGEN